MIRKAMALALVVLFITACRNEGLVINVNFEQLSGIEKGDRVLFEGNTAGRVEQVQFNTDGSFTVRLFIEKGFANAVTEYSRFQIVGDPDKEGRKSIRIELAQLGGTQLADGASVTGLPPDKDLGTLLQEELEAGFGILKEQIDKFGRDVKAFSESQQYRDLKKSLKDMADEMEHMEERARDEVKKEWLPKIQRELDELREYLRQLGREEELAPLEKEVERIRRI